MRVWIVSLRIFIILIRHFMHSEPFRVSFEISFIYACFVTKSAWIREKEEQIRYIKCNSVFHLLQVWSSVAMSSAACCPFWSSVIMAHADIFLDSLASVSNFDYYYYLDIIVVLLILTLSANLELLLKFFVLLHRKCSRIFMTMFCRSVILDRWFVSVLPAAFPGGSASAQSHIHQPTAGTVHSLIAGHPQACMRRRYLLLFITISSSSSEHNFLLRQAKGRFVSISNSYYRLHDVSRDMICVTKFKFTSSRQQNFTMELSCPMAAIITN